MLIRTLDERAIHIEPDFDCLEHIFDKRIAIFFEKSFLGCMINWPDRPIIMKNVRERCVEPILNRIDSIGDIHNANFV